MKALLASITLFLQMSCLGQCLIDTNTINKFAEAFNGKILYKLDKCDYGNCGWNQIETIDFTKSTFVGELQDKVFYEYGYAGNFKEENLILSLITRNVDSILALQLTNYIVCKYKPQYDAELKKCREATAKYYNINFDSYIFDYVQEPPSYVGGESEMEKFIHKNLIYPEKAKSDKKEGEIGVKFLVDKEGNLSDFKIIQGLGYGLDEEAVRILKLMPKWNPGVQLGVKVNVSYMSVIVFKLP